MKINIKLQITRRRATEREKVEKIFSLTPTLSQREREPNALSLWADHVPHLFLDTGWGIQMRSKAI